MAPRKKTLGALAHGKADRFSKLLKEKISELDSSYYPVCTLQQDIEVPVSALELNGSVLCSFPGSSQWQLKAAGPTEHTGSVSLCLVNSDKSESKDIQHITFALAFRPVHDKSKETSAWHFEKVNGLYRATSTIQNVGPDKYTGFQFPRFTGDLKSDFIEEEFGIVNIHVTLHMWDFHSHDLKDVGLGIPIRMLNLAAYMGHTECLQVMIDLKVNLEATDDLGRTALRIACEEANERCAKVLIDAGADVNSLDKYSTSSLIASADANHIICAQFLLAAKANVQQADMLGRTSLMQSTSTSINSSEMTELLLKHGANINAKDNDGNTALDYAQLKNDSHSLIVLGDALARSENSHGTHSATPTSEHSVSSVENNIPRLMPPAAPVSSPVPISAVPVISSKPPNGKKVSVAKRLYSEMSASSSSSDEEEEFQRRKQARRADHKSKSHEDALVRMEARLDADRKALKHEKARLISERKTLYEDIKQQKMQIAQLATQMEARMDKERMRMEANYQQERTRMYADLKVKEDRLDTRWQALQVELKELAEERRQVEKDMTQLAMMQIIKRQ